jgi:hypothetical protein
MFVYDAFWNGVTVRAKTSLDDRATQLIVSGDDLKWQLWLDSKVGEPYDKFAILLIVIARFLPDWLHITDTRQGIWWCSHLSGVVAGITDYSRPLTPQELLEQLTEKNENVQP